MSNRAGGVRVAYPLFRVGGGGSTPTSALDLEVNAMNYADARKLNSLWHSRLPKLPRMVPKESSYGAIHDGLYYAIAVWSLPVARLLPNDGTWLELRRMAVAPDAPRNTASRFLAVMTKMIRKQMPGVVRLISYQDTEVHTGGIYRACGWNPIDCSKSQTRWDMPGRVRSAPQSDAVKVRWELALRPTTTTHGDLT